MFLFAGTTQKVMAQGEDVSLQSFYDELSPYGTWIQDPQYGYVWRPDVDQEEFRPYYTNGRWAMTEYGNTWVSDYEWGWAPFHYGRWIYNRYNQWIWIPDTVWGPAWVSWRSGGGYYGWAPLGPSINIGINIGRGGYRIPDMCWNFIPYSNIYYNNYPRYSWSRNRVYIQNTVIINNTYIRNNRTYYVGPRADDIYRHTNQRVTVYNVNRSHGPGRSQITNNTVNIYQPRPSRGNNNAPQAPRSVVQGSINRGPVSRDAVAANRNERGGRNDDVYNRGGSMDNRNIENRRDNSGVGRPSRNEGTINGSPNRESGNRNGNYSRPNGFDRSESRSEQPQRVERERNSPYMQGQQSPRAERPMEAPQRIERSEPQRAERQQPAPQRMERAERQQPQRMERSQSQGPSRMERSQPQRSAGGREGGASGGGREGAGGRPGRG